MAKVVLFEPRKHVYELENCAGCGKKIEGDFTELGLPSPDNKVMTHIALCSKCTAIAKSEGVI